MQFFGDIFFRSPPPVKLLVAFGMRRGGGVLRLGFKIAGLVEIYIITQVTVITCPLAVVA